MEVKKAKISTNTDAIEKLVLNGLEFVSIQDEEYRTYSVPVDGMVYELTIDKPMWLFVRPSGSHMVIDGYGVTHYIPNFVHLAWFNGDKTPVNF